MQSHEGKVKLRGPSIKTARAVAWAPTHTLRWPYRSSKRALVHFYVVNSRATLMSHESSV